MGWDALLFGALEFPPGGLEAWKSLVIEKGLYDDEIWKASYMMGEPIETQTVAGLLVKLEAHARWCAEKYAGPDHQRVHIQGDRVSVRAYINEDDFTHWAGSIATMMRLGERVGAVGEYVALANDGNDCERLVIAKGASRCDRLDGLETLSGEEYGATVREISDAATAKMQRVREQGAVTSAAKTKPATKKPPVKKKTSR